MGASFRPITSKEEDAAEAIRRKVAPTPVVTVGPLRPGPGVRTPEEQARYVRQSPIRGGLETAAAIERDPSLGDPYRAAWERVNAPGVAETAADLFVGGAGSIFSPAAAEGAARESVRRYAAGEGADPGAAVLPGARTFDPGLGRWVESGDVTTADVLGAAEAAGGVAGNLLPIGSIGGRARAGVEGAVDLVREGTAAAIRRRAGLPGGSILAAVLASGGGRRAARAAAAGAVEGGLLGATQGGLDAAVTDQDVIPGLVRGGAAGMAAGGLLGGGIRAGTEAGVALAARRAADANPLAAMAADALATREARAGLGEEVVMQPPPARELPSTLRPLDPDNLPATVERAAEALDEQGGFSIDPRTGEPPTSGFAVGLGGAPPAGDAGPGAIQAALRRMRPTLERDPSLVAGGWRDANTGEVFLEPSRRTASEHEARAMTLANRERAYFDLGAGEERRILPELRAPRLLNAGPRQLPDELRERDDLFPQDRELFPADRPGSRPDRLSDAAAADRPELPVAAASRARDGRMFTGAVHMLAREAGREAGAGNDFTDGFLTNRGRFVGREEAARLAKSRAREYDAVDIPLKLRDKPAAEVVPSAVPNERKPDAGSDPVRVLARSYMARTGIGTGDSGPFAPEYSPKADASFGRRVADAYEAAPLADDSPETREAYTALAREVEAQYDHLVSNGVRFDFTDKDPYPNSAALMEAVRRGEPIRVFKTPDDNFHPFLTPEQNDKFRAVHDYFGHTAEGFQFGPGGEDNAYRKHASMFTPLARRALATETRGQNSWVNYGPYGEANRADPKNTRFADQKTFLLPNEMVDRGAVPRETPGSGLPGAGDPFDELRGGDMFRQDRELFGRPEREPDHYPGERLVNSIRDKVAVRRAIREDAERAARQRETDAAIAAAADRDLRNTLGASFSAGWTVEDGGAKYKNWVVASPDRKTVRYVPKEEAPSKQDAIDYVRDQRAENFPRITDLTSRMREPGFRDDALRNIRRAQDGFDRGGGYEPPAPYDPRSPDRYSDADPVREDAIRRAVENRRLPNEERERLLAESRATPNPDAPIAEKVAVRRSTKEVSEILAARSGPVADDTFKARLARAVERGVPDALDALTKMPDAAEWYKASIARMERAVESMIPETRDRTMMRLFKAVTAITSNGLKPAQNLPTAVALFTKWLDTGDLSFFKGGSTRRGTAALYDGVRDESVPGNPRFHIMEHQLKKLVGHLGPDRATWDEKLVRLYTDRTTEQYKYKPSQEVVETDTPMSADFFGPKIGRFYANLNGSAQDVTVDVWAVRTLRGWLGYTSDQLSAKGFTETPAPTELEGAVMRHAVTRIAESLTEQTGQHFDPMDVQALLWYYEKQRYVDLGARDSEQLAYDTAAEAEAARRTGGDGAGAPNADEGGGAAPVAPAGTGGAGQAPGIARAARPDRYSDRAPVEGDPFAELRSDDFRQDRELFGPGPGERPDPYSGGRFAGSDAAPARNPTPERYDAPPEAKANLRRLDLDPEAERVVLDALERNAEGKTYISFDQIRERADELGLDPKRLVNRTDGLTESETLALMDAVSSESRRAVSLGNDFRAALASNDPAAIEAAQDALARATANVEQFTSRLQQERTRKGRELGALRIMARATMEPAPWLLHAERIKGLPVTPDERDTLTKLLGAGDREGAVRFVSSLRRSTGWEQAVGFWRAMLLTAPTTTIANLTGNASHLAFLATTKPLVYAMDVTLAGIKSATRGGSVESNRVTGASVNPFGVAWVRDLPPALRRARLTWKNGQPPGDVKWDTRRTTYDRVLGSKRVGSAVEAAVNSVYDFMSAQDQFFREVAEGVARREYARIDARQWAKDAGVPLGGQAHKDKIAELEREPTLASLIKIKTYGAAAVFGDENLVAKGIARFRRTMAEAGGAYAAATDFAVPFTHTPTNIAARTLDYAGPGALARAASAVKAGDEKRAIEQLASGALGAGGFVALGFLAAAGVIPGVQAYGAAPTDQGDAQLRRARKIKPNSITVNGVNIAIARVAPVGTLIALGAQIHDAYANAALPNGGVDASKVASGSAASYGRVIADQPMLKGVSGIANALNDPARKGEILAESYAGSVVPALVGRVAEGLDAYRRNVDGPAESFLNRIPGARTYLEPERDFIFGDPNRNERGLARTLLDPLTSERVKNSPIYRELERTGEVPLAPGDIADPMTAKGTRTRTEAEKLRIVADYGPEFKVALGVLFADPGYRRLPIDQQRSAIRSTANLLKTEARQREAGASDARSSGAAVAADVLGDAARQERSRERRFSRDSARADRLAGSGVELPDEGTRTLLESRGKARLRELVAKGADDAARATVAQFGAQGVDLRSFYKDLRRGQMLRARDDSTRAGLRP